MAGGFARGDQRRAREAQHVVGFARFVGVGSAADGVVHENSRVSLIDGSGIVELYDKIARGVGFDGAGDCFDVSLGKIVVLDEDLYRVG